MSRILMFGSTAIAVIGLLGAGRLAAAQGAAARSAGGRSVAAVGGEEHFRVPVQPSGLRVFIRHVGATRRGPGSGRPPVLFVHGATLPSGLAFAFRFDGVSGMDDLARRGFDVWALDFLGYGGSDWYAEMSEPAAAHPPLGRAPEAARQIAAAVEFIAARQGAPRVTLIAHSWGTIPAGLYATTHPARVERLVQFGPVTVRQGARDTSVTPAYVLVTMEEQIERFTGYPPEGQVVFEPRHLTILGPAYLDTDPTSWTRSPASVRAPAGFAADLEDAWSGTLGYDPGKITAPVMIIRGEWEDITTDADARWLFDALTAAPLKRDVKIGRATHVMHLESTRYQLYSEVAAFLAADDTLPSPVGRTEPGPVTPVSGTTRDAGRAR